MTVSTTTISNTAAGNGVTTSFPYTFSYDSNDLTVVKVGFIVDDVLTEQVSGFTVTAGSVTFSTAPPSGTSVFIWRDTPETQPATFANQGPFYARNHEVAFDRATRQIQELQAQTARSLRLPLTESGIVPLPATDPANKVVGFDSLGRPTFLDVTVTDAAVLRADLASDSPGNGASLVALEDGRTVQDFADDLAGSGGASEIGFIQAGIGAVARTLQAKAREWVTPADFGAVGDGVADDTQAFQDCAATGQPVYVPAGVYLLTDTVTLADGFDWQFSRRSVIRNGTAWTIGTTSALFFAVGSASAALTTINGTFNRNASAVVTVASAAGISVGDFLAFEDASPSSGFTQFHAAVVSIAGNNLTLDRAPACDLANGGDVDRVTPVRGKFDGATFDGNGTIASPRYGFGFIGRYHRGVEVRNVRAYNFASKVVEIQRGADSFVHGVLAERATDASAGEGYAVRVANGNDNHVSNVRASYCRHVVDLTSASRNKVSACSGENGQAADFLTHFSGCIGNTFTDCNSSNSITAAYSFTPSSGDEDNVVLGGTVFNSALNRPNAVEGPDYKGNKFVGVNIVAVSRQAVAFSSQLYGCNIECRGTAAFADGGGVCQIKMVGGSIRAVTASVSVANFTNASAGTTLELDGVRADLETNYRTFASSGNVVTGRFRNCLFNHIDATTGNNSALCWNRWASSFIRCASLGVSSTVHYSLSTGNTLEARDCSMAAQASGFLGRDVVGNVVTATIDRQSLQRIGAGAGTVTIAESRYDYTAATTLGTVVGKTAIYDVGGTLRGYAPVYDNIT